MLLTNPIGGTFAVAVSKRVIAKKRCKLSTAAGVIIKMMLFARIEGITSHEPTTASPKPTGTRIFILLTFHSVVWMFVFARIDVGFIIYSERDDTALCVPRYTYLRLQR